VTPAEQAILEAEESLLEPENEDDVNDDDSNDVTDNENMEDREGHDRDNIDDKKEDDGVDENEKVMDDAQKSVSSVFSVLIKLLDREVGRVSSSLSIPGEPPLVLTKILVRTTASPTDKFVLFFVKITLSKAPFTRDRMNFHDFTTRTFACYSVNVVLN
jgi:hypothetical protein